MSHRGWLSPTKSTIFLVSTSLLSITGLVANVSKSMEIICFNHFWLRLWCFKPDPVEEQWEVRPNNCSLGFSLAISPWQAFLVLVLILLGFHNLGSQIFFGRCPINPWAELWALGWILDSTPSYSNPSPHCDRPRHATWHHHKNSPPHSKMPITKRLLWNNSHYANRNSNLTNFNLAN